MRCFAICFQQNKDGEKLEFKWWVKTTVWGVFATFRSNAVDRYAGLLAFL
jgi:hypothetical protein